LGFAVYFSRENILMMRKGIPTKAVVAEGCKRSVGFGHQKGTQYFAYVYFENAEGKELVCKRIGFTKKVMYCRFATRPMITKKLWPFIVLKAGDWQSCWLSLDCFCAILASLSFL